MKLLSWNVRGLGLSRTTRRLKNFLRDVKPTVIFLIETKLPNTRMEKVRKLLGFPNGVDVAAVGRSGGLSMAWRSSCRVAVRSYSCRHIDIMVEDDSNGFSWRCTGFYGAPEVQNRAAAWDLLRQLDDIPQVPWLVIGDFNVILFASEKVGGLPRNQWQMDNFISVLNDCSLEDIGYEWSWFTWEWGRL
ncbi:hypothetical protein HRI_003856700 [Hibiscus trionum]|uniref:Endonuclease/exonuclease/phosphatase domain-containing protein n=1 Tax=Hibiscus trionum TaxID=183268 RepID=A0A9W7ITQ4_HIBTR|nr:hypothetical protein HRI_003856700 [Hibiscus trionum]